jgi:hypothetical protein
MMLTTTGGDAPTTTASIHELRPGLDLTAARRWRAFALPVAAYFTTIIDFTIVNVAIPTIRSLHSHDTVALLRLPSPANSNGPCGSAA